MKFNAPKRRAMGESIVPMINVVFLLLIFFLMTAQIAPPEPFEVTLPESTTEAEADGQTILFISDEGELAFEDLRAEAALDAISAQLGEGEPLLLRADRGVDATEIARLMPQLAALGVREVKLVSTNR